MNNILKNLIFECIILGIVLSSLNAFNCRLPEGCRLENVYNSYYGFYYNQKEFETDQEIMCDVNEKFEFIFNHSTPLNNNNEKCFLDTKDFFKKSRSNIIFRWKSSSNESELKILEKGFNFTYVMKYISFFMPYVYLNLWGIKGFDVEFLGENYTYEKSLNSILLSDCRLNFYHNKKKIKSCQDLIDSNITQVSSIFQIIIPDANDMTKAIEFRNVEYKEKENICPLVFQNAKLLRVLFNALMDSFYKKNVVSFSNETYPQLNSSIKVVELHNCHNINIDLNLLHQSVFYNLKILLIASGSLKSISGDIFKSFSDLYLIQIHPTTFRKINHRQGIEWIRQMNFGVNVSLSNETVKEDYKHFLNYKIIQLERTPSNPRTPLTVLLPDEDFCIYVDYPFNQLIVTNEFYNELIIGTRNFNTELSCTYLWLIQYYEYYNKYLGFNYAFTNYIRKVLNSKALKSISKCNFEQRIISCNKTNYQRKDIWDESDFFILNKKIQIAFKISLYPVSLLCLITNFIVVLVILIKDNSDLFNEYKQYNYLYLNSIVCIMISVIEILSWMTECFYPFEVFCPEIRKLVAIQFFKIIFTECSVTFLRFMCNFTYVAFALNRISLLGKDHGKVVTFMSKVGIKKYIGVTFLTSLFLSWMKYFQYEVNYFYPHLNFPMFNQVSMVQSKPTTFKDVFFIFNVISDLVNYFVFVVICLIIDICMVVQLRRTLVEKLKKSESLNQNQNESKKIESEEAVNKAIKMVVLNGVIGIFFKLPVCFIPLLNVCAEFYYKSEETFVDKDINFGEFFQYLFDSEFYDLIQDISHFLFTLSLSIQMFIYYRFDKKFLTGYQRIMDKAFAYIKSFF